MYVGIKNKQGVHYMRGLSGLRILLIVALLFTMLTAVNSSELFNGTTDSSSLLLNKIDVQMEQIVPMSVEGVVSVFSDNIKQQSLNSIIYINNEIVFVSGSLSEVSYKLNNTSLYAETVNMVVAYTSFEVENLIMELHDDNSVNSISGLRGGYLQFSRFSQQSYEIV